MASPFSKRFRWLTLIVVVGCVLCIRLGFWQLDRLAQRRALSAELAARATAAPIVLDRSHAGLGVDGGNTPDDTALRALEFRRVVIRGMFDHDHDLALTNQVWDGRLGFHLITPLVIEGTGHTVLVDRGWIPAAEATPEAWARYRTTGLLAIEGWIRLSRRTRGSPSALAAASAANAAAPERLIPALDVPRLQQQLARPLLPVVVVQAPDHAPASGAGSAPPAPPAPSALTRYPETPATLPYRKPLATDLGDGVHLVVAAQWFAFAVIGTVGYTVYLRRNATEV